MRIWKEIKDYFNGTNNPEEHDQPQVFKEAAFQKLLGELAQKHRDELEGLALKRAKQNMEAAAYNEAPTYQISSCHDCDIMQIAAHMERLAGKYFVSKSENKMLVNNERTKHVLFTFNWDA